MKPLLSPLVTAFRLLVHRGLHFVELSFIGELPMSSAGVNYFKGSWAAKVSYLKSEGQRSPQTISYLTVMNKS